MKEIEEKVKLRGDDRPEKPLRKAKSFLNKVVIRKLPPNLNSELFVEMISPLPDIHDLYFQPADWTLGAEATSRAYIEFKREEDIFIFKDKFDGYVFVDGVRGSEYPAIVEYAAFQGLPKSRARKKDKNVGTIESEQHFLNFLDQLKKDEDADNQKSETKIEYSYQIKDDKKVTSTPLIEFLSAKNQEKRDAKRKKVEDKKKQRDDDKHRKKIMIAKNIPESVKEVKEEVDYGDGVVVRTVPSRLGRNDRNERKKDLKPEPKSEKDSGERDQERRDKREKEKTDREARRKIQKEKEDKRKAEKREQQKLKDQDQKKTFGESSTGEKASTSNRDSKRDGQGKESRRDASYKEPNKDEPAAKSETKRYSALRKARQEKTSETSEPTESLNKQKDSDQKEETQKSGDDENKNEEKQNDFKSAELEKAEQAKKEARMKRSQELKERRAREADERAQRQIKNKDRPTLQFYQPKRRDNDSKTDNMKSSDENSETSRKRSDNDRRSDRRERERKPEKKTSRKNSRDETGRRKKPSRKNSYDGAVDNPNDSEAVVDKLLKLVLDDGKAQPDTEDQKPEMSAEASKAEKNSISDDDVK